MEEHEKHGFPLTGKIGTYDYDLTPCKTERNTIDLELMSLFYRKLSLQILNDIEKNPNPLVDKRVEYFNFFCDTTGLRGKQIAFSLQTEPKLFGQYRLGKKPMPDEFWQSSRKFFKKFFTDWLKEE